MSRIIINNKSDLTDSDALVLVKRVIEMGRISNDEKQYCYLTSFPKINTENDYHVATDLRKKSDSFTIYKAPQQGKQEKEK